MSQATRAKSARRRASIAACMLKKNQSFGRAFDDCFEMNDAPEVMDWLIRKTAIDPILAFNIKVKMPQLGYGESNTRLHQAINQALMN